MLQRGFDEDWYSETYAEDIAQHAGQYAGLFDFYCRFGARIGHDPNEGFSEILYRLTNIDVRKSMLADPMNFAYRHYLEYGINEEGRWKFDVGDARAVRRVYRALDRAFLAKEYGARSTGYPDIADFYFARVATDKLSPSPEFSESGYRELNKDILPSIEAGVTSSGFAHFLAVEGKEMRPIISHKGYLAAQKKVRDEAAEAETQLALESNLPGITHLAAFDALNAMEFYDGYVDIEVTPATGTGGLLVMVPDFLPEILFGGYLAFYDFLDKLRAETGITLHLMVLNASSQDKHANNLLRMRRKMPSIFGMFDDFQKFDPAKRKISVPRNFHVISYCAELHRIATKIAGRLGQKPIFFIQEFEPDFHANTDMRSFNESAFLLPHDAVYNSAKLIEYFQKRTPVFARAGEGYRFASIENAIRPLDLDREAYLEKHRGKSTRRLIMYGRPEGHAARNHFATLVYALRHAVRHGVFSAEPWDFVAIGSLAFKNDIDLSGAEKLRMMPKMPKAEYEDFLLTGDIGMSVITTPHPGIVHFQMAAYGLTTITNRTELRDDAWLAAQNRNLVPVDMNLESIVDGFREAVKRSRDLDARHANALATPMMRKEDCLRGALDLMGKIVRE